MKFYEQYPMMKPHVGSKYGCGNAPRLLLIGESHYLPDEATQHLDTETWYGKNSSTLNPEEKDHIDTAGVVKSACDENFANPSFSIFANSFWEINENGPHFPEYKHVADHVVFYNFFLRPGLNGESLKATPKDVEFANQAFNFLISVEPQLPAPGGNDRPVRLMW
ncbi:hypothetical protein OS187_08095 [Xanthomonadaceae bacterium JHOS43]|nr:hypothetical protein [Xanthomonadaceae bacterium JHOS43]